MALYTDEDLDAATDAGILTRETVAALRAHVASRHGGPQADEEYVRLVSSFNDLFVFIACVLVLVSTAWLAGRHDEAYGGAAVAVVAWALAEHFTRRRRMALPSIVLTLAFIGGVAVTAGTWPELEGDMPILMSAGAAAVAAGLHWWRFHVPITVAAGTGTLVFALTGSALDKLPDGHVGIPTVAFVTGLVVIAMALRWDASDPARRTRRADVAFWLHMLAAPLLVHPVFSWMGVLDGDLQPTHAALVLVLYVMLALVSLLIDRRALLVSALVYVLYASRSLLEQSGVVDVGWGLTALAIGAALLLLSIFWRSSRERMLRAVPARWRDRLAPVR